MKVFQTLAEGGQTWAHRVRMVRQVVKLGLSFSLLVTFSYFTYAIYQIEPLLLQSGYYRLKAEVLSKIVESINVDSSYWQAMSHEIIHTSKKNVPIYRLKRLTQPHIEVLLAHGKQISVKALFITLLSFGGMLLFFLWRGASSKKKQHISGKKRIHPFILRLRLILKRQASDIKIGVLPLLKGSETQHTLVTGGTGSGKTNCFHHILPKIRLKKQKTVIIDTTGVFVERYYNPQKDIILNPFDDRGVPWHPWVECENRFDFDSLAESFIPQSHHDYENYWRTASRSLLSSVLQKISDVKRTSELSQWLLFEPLDKLAEFVQGTRAAAHIDVNSEKTAASIRSVAASFLTCLEHLKDTDTPFSIKKWIQQKDQEGWLFLNAQPAQRASLNPLISCWFSVAVRGLMQMSHNLDRRIWFVIDELPTLQKLKELNTLVTESRKHGGCGLLALQSPSQLEEIYGKAATQTLIGNCATRIVFAEHDPEISERISRSLGEIEIKEYQEGISYGAHEVRDGVSLSLQTKKMPIVSSSEIQSLENNKAYIRLPGNTPITKISLKPKKRKCT